MGRQCSFQYLYSIDAPDYPMKIIHTADWHVGHELYGYDREEEFDYFFSQLSELLRAERPDALLVSGDVYDSYMPSTTAVRQLNNALLRLHDSSPETEIILTSGNHDSGPRLEAAAPPWLPHGVHLIGTIDPTLERNRIEIEGKGVVMAIPFCYPANFPHADGDPLDGRQERFFQRIIEQLSRESLPTVLMAHLYVSGAALNGSRQPRDIVGGSEAMALGDITGGYDYLALGHIHRRQRLSARAYYSGSPLPISFDEPAEHGVLLVELEKGEEPRVDFRQMKTLRPLLTLPKEAAPFEEAIRELREMDPESNAYVRLHVLGDGSLPFDHLEQASKALEKKRGRYCTIKIESPQTDRVEAKESRAITPEELVAMDPVTIVGKYLQDRGLAEEEREELLGLFRSIDALCEKEEIEI